VHNSESQQDLVPGFQGDLLALGEPRSTSPLPVSSPLTLSIGLGLRLSLGLMLRLSLGLGLCSLATGLRPPSDGLRLLLSLPRGLSPRSESLCSLLSFGGGLTRSRGLGLLGLRLPSGVGLRSFAGGETDRLGLLL
jgi:hypothetical protein